MTKAQFDEIDSAFGQLNTALAEAHMSYKSGYLVTIAYEKVKAALQPHLKIEEPTPTDEKPASNPT